MVNNLTGDCQFQTSHLFPQGQCPIEFAGLDVGLLQLLQFAMQGQPHATHALLSFLANDVFLLLLFIYPLTCFIW